MPVSLDEAKSSLRIVSTNDDEFISFLILQASTLVEKQTGQTMIQTQYRLTLSEWDSHRHHGHDLPFAGFDMLLLNRPYCRTIVKLPRFPLVSIDSFTVDGSAFTDYGIYDTAPSKLRIHHPHHPAAYENGIVITFTAGYAERELVPPTLKGAIKLIVSQWYNNRDGGNVQTFNEIPMGIMNLLNLESFDSVQ
jgi:hypothetical protein